MYGSLSLYWLMLYLWMHVMLSSSGITFILNSSLTVMKWRTRSLSIRFFGTFNIFDWHMLVYFGIRLCLFF
jgi:hypothetical protein